MSEGPGNEMQGSTAARGSWWAAFLVFPLMALPDWVLTVWDDRGFDGPNTLALLLSLGLWSLAGLIVVPAEALLGRILFGRRGWGEVLARAARWWAAALAETDAATDRSRVANLWGGLAWLALLSAGSVFLIGSLVANRHGALLIAVTVVVAQTALAGLGLAAAFAIRRFLLALLGRFPADGVAATVFSFAGSVVFLAGAGALAAVAVVVLFHSTIIAVDGISLLLPAAALLAQIPAYHVWNARGSAGQRREGSLSAAVLVPLLALGGVWGAGQVPATRQAVVMHSATSKYLFALVQELSDFDGDASATFPVAEDCAPFDSAIHPYAPEKPGNGLDENCDGLDQAPAFAAAGLPKRPSLPRPSHKPDLLLITVDALRADHIGFLGYERAVTPNIDRVADKSAVFTMAFSQSSGTGPSAWSLMAGKTPFQVELVDTDRFPPNYGGNEFTLAEVLREWGYATVAVTCARMFDRENWNIRRGFDSFQMPCGKKHAYMAPVVLKNALSKLKKLRKGRKPFFLWVHFLDPHHPYSNHPDDDLGDRPIDNYDEEIRYTDEHLGDLLDEAIGKTGARPLYVALYADHGENFDEHGPSHHARTLYREVTHVPLMIHGPDVIPALIDAPVATGDLYPTLIELAGLDIPEGCTMVSQVPVLLGGAADYERLVFQENSWSRPRRHVKGVVGLGYHMLLDTTTNTTELYNLEEDPRERNNLSGSDIPEEDQLREALLRFIGTTHLPQEMQ